MLILKVKKTKDQTISLPMESQLYQQHHLKVSITLTIHIINLYRNKVSYTALRYKLTFVFKLVVVWSLHKIIAVIMLLYTYAFNYNLNAVDGGILSAKTLYSDSC